MDLQEDFIEMSFVARLSPALLQPVGIRLTKSLTPLANRLIRYNDATLRQEFLDVPIAQMESKVKPDRMRNDLDSTHELRNELQGS